MTETWLSVLEDELAAWTRAGRKPVIWWRDDDAIEPSAALDRLLGLAQRFRFPICVAVIPGLVTPELGVCLDATQGVCVATHGYMHTDHSAKEQKKTELTENLPSRSVETVLTELETARQRMRQLFGDAAADLLVPPWNRMSDAVAAALPQAGFKVVSGFAERRFNPAVAQMDCHLDLMEWRPVKKGKALAAILVELEAQLRFARETGRDHIGILSHHLVHDETAWETCEALMQFICENTVLQTASVLELAALEK
ncbi:polysaccharide deacetylase family protein [Rhizobium sp. L1K21]|uniref:polysaccharide deacetylase family protein n=1 Tax=Rhizobium sp. L1K21 TaxID=2954933 RepID=UPI002093E872|nr:polysaccharide deacetylase family protein [Rhizobium sp. L1K21]MCO6187650.1 polysaccharide deacetylase family protein [Rhizobium sp. L1K21]